MEGAVEYGFDLPSLPHLADFVEYIANEGTIFLEIQKATQIETTNALVLLIQL